ncbi:MAG: hypothetical protein MI807_16615 [Verrucomicrobiales bacterium]|nr:hypothetical protein [Verrucomicrobiales bacterium]
MKRLPLFSFGLVSLFLLNPVAADPRAKAPMRDAASHDELSRKLRMAQQKDPIREIGPARGKIDEDPSLQNTKRDLISSSTIISFNGLLTLVPKRSVLVIPEKLSSRIGEKENVKVVNFRDFMVRNRGWIRTMEVTRPQALGHVPFEEETIKAIEDSTSLVIATYKGGPISVLPAKDPEEVPSKADMKPVIFRK